MKRKEKKDSSFILKYILIFLLLILVYFFIPRLFGKSNFSLGGAFLSAVFMFLSIVSFKSISYWTRRINLVKEAIKFSDPNQYQNGRDYCFIGSLQSINDNMLTGPITNTQCIYYDYEIGHQTEKEVEISMNGKENQLYKDYSGEAYTTLLLNTSFGKLSLEGNGLLVVNKIPVNTFFISEEHSQYFLNANSYIKKPDMHFETLQENITKNINMLKNKMKT